jgi:flavin-dependent dehydrogenase
MKVGIIGGGPAGLYLAYLLTKNGMACQLFDHQIPHEKACGGGVTTKALRQFDILRGLPTIARPVATFEFISPQDRRLLVRCDQPLQIVSRQVLSQYMLDQCHALGFAHTPEEVRTLVRADAGTGWQVGTKAGEHYCDFVVGADGAHGLSRRLLGAKPFLKDRYAGLGFYVDGLETDRAVIKFFPQQAGYLWVFPRPGHASVGLGFLSGTMTKEKAFGQVAGFLAQHYPGFRPDERRSYAATIPFTRHWEPAHVQGDGFALIGDAGGFTDAITGEGIYFAFKSAEILAHCLLAGQPGQFYAQCGDMVRELQKSANILARFYQDHLLNGMVWAGQRSGFVRQLLGRLILGEQAYTTLKPTLKANALRVVAQVAQSYLRPGRAVAG